jgi:glutamate synthase (NADPH/NADH) large chain
MTMPLHRTEARGLYDPSAEHDACGVAFVATLRGTPGRDIVDAGLTALLNLDHRGAVGAEEDTGDGAGILTQIPDAFLRDVVDAELPPAGRYAIGTAFLPTDEAQRDQVVARVDALAAQEKLDVHSWRDLPVDA